MGFEIFYYDKTFSFDPLDAPLYSPRSPDITFNVQTNTQENTKFLFISNSFTLMTINLDKNINKDHYNKKYVQ